MIAAAGAGVRVERNDAISAAEAEEYAPTHLVISPGPGTPRETGVSGELLDRLAGRIPILGVCLGHQLIVERYGGRVDRARCVVHGKPDRVRHDGSPLYAGLPTPFEAGRYHSLAALRVPPELAVSARSPDGEVMGVRHEAHETHGVQFHPESVLTPHGGVLVANFLWMGGRL
jgi:anthranilate synthase/aminodeoxychorismate synthase-like glutamine amidotransferase